MADRVQLQQVLMNLMLNGIEAMADTGGILTVRAEAGPDGEILISVSDTGPGLPPDKAGRIFDAFFTTKPKGSGMGRAISKSIVESHGGRIWASGDPGHGAIFHFTLPASPAKDPDTPNDATDSALSETRQREVARFDGKSPTHCRSNVGSVESCPD